MLLKVLALLFVCLPVFAQSSHISSGSTVYIDSSEGYASYLAAAFSKKNVPLVVVTDKTKADYIVSSSVNQSARNQPAIVINNGSGDTASPSNKFPWSPSSEKTSVSMSVIDSHSSQVVFAYSVGKNRDTNQLQSAAEACAKHLKEFIEKPKK